MRLSMWKNRPFEVPTDRERDWKRGRFGDTLACMNMPFSFMRALGNYGQTQPITRPPTMIRPYPGQVPGAPAPWQPQDMIEQEAPGYLPGGIKPPTMPDAAPDVKPPEAPDAPDEMGLGQQFLRALGQTIGGARRSSQDRQPFFVRQRTE